jgi:hypothetical protein
MSFSMNFLEEIKVNKKNIKNILFIAFI